MLCFTSPTMKMLFLPCQVRDTLVRMASWIRLLSWYSSIITSRNCSWYTRAQGEGRSPSSVFSVRMRRAYCSISE